MTKTSHNVSGGTIAFAIGATLVFSLIFAVVGIMKGNVSFFMAAVYPLFHPIIGKILCELVHTIGKGVDIVYEIALIYGFIFRSLFR